MDEDKVLAALVRLEQGQANLLSDMTTLKTDVAGLQAEQHSTRKDIDSLRREQTEFRVVVMDRFERVENRLSAMSEDITTNMGAAMHALKRQDNDREEVRALTTMVHQMYTQVKRLQTDMTDVQTKILMQPRA